ncbi:MAG: hypothetical protein IBJ12_12745 [Sphingomonadaceae bacterium]|nr:hypothetical protein [Sphingomonadaceae bacterium]
MIAQHAITLQAELQSFVVCENGECPFPETDLPFQARDGDNYFAIA